MTNNIGHLFFFLLPLMYLLWWSIYSNLAHLKIVLCVLLLTCKYILYILDPSPLLDRFVQYFLPVCGLPFQSCNSVFPLCSGPPPCPECPHCIVGTICVSPIKMQAAQEKALLLYPFWFLDIQHRAWPRVEPRVVWRTEHDTRKGMTIFVKNYSSLVQKWLLEIIQVSISLSRSRASN